MPRTDAAPGADASLDDWLRWQERVHPRSIELGLERTRVVAERLGLLAAPPVTLTVAGTNGKGSTTTLAAAIYRAAGYRVGAYTSPHLLRYNERVALDGQPVEDAALCRAFTAIEAAREAVPLTYFEYGTLAALFLFREARVDVEVLEVGLGGRLDAVNIVDADAALLTNVGLDHRDWLGPDREAIGREKAGIFRHARPAICVDSDPPASVGVVAAAVGADLRCLGVTFDYAIAADGRWHWHGTHALESLPAPGLAGPLQYRNAAGVLAAVEALQPQLPVPDAAIRHALPALALAGRLQRHGDLLLDVGHNVEAADALAEVLKTSSPGRRVLVLGMLADKPVEEYGRRLAPYFERIYAAGLPPPRGLDGMALAERLGGAGVEAAACDDVSAALARARHESDPDTRPIWVTGSFLTVAAALSCS